MATAEQGVTQELARYIARTRYEDLPPEAVQATKNCILEALSGEVAGCTRPSAMYQYVRAYGGRPESTIVNYGDRVAATDAAMVNATFGGGGMFHTAPGSASVATPVAIAVGEKLPSSGKEIINAVALGNDLSWRLQMSLMPSLMQRGFYPPAVTGNVMTAAVAGRLLGLGEEETADALGIAVAQASGTLEFEQSGGDVSGIQMGLVARNGIQSALLAQLGVKGPRTPLEGTKGLGHAFSDGGRWEVLIQGLGQDFKVLDVSFNRYPVGPMENPLDTFVNLAAEHNVTPDQVEEIHFRISAHFLNHGAGIYEPWDRTSARWSLAFSCGLRLVKGSNDPSLYDDPNLWKDEAILGVAHKMTAEANPEAQGPHRRLTHLQVRLKDGRVLERSQEGPRGSPVDPMSPQELRERFRSRFAPLLSPQRTEQVIDIVEGLDSMDDVSELPALLVAG